MDPLQEKYCVFSSNPDEVVTLGNFQFKWTRTPDAHYKNYVRIEHGVRYMNGDWYTKASDHFIGGRHANANPHDMYLGLASKISYRGCFHSLLYNKQKSARYGYGYGSRNNTLYAELEKEIKKDFNNWRKLRKKLKDKTLEEEAASEGITLQEKYDKMRLRAQAENTIELTNLKIKALQEIEKHKTMLEEAADKIEAGTFTADDASDIRWMGKSLGGTGLGPTLRKIASLSKKR